MKIESISDRLNITSIEHLKIETVVQTKVGQRARSKYLTPTENFEEIHLQMSLPSEILIQFSSFFCGIKFGVSSTFRPD